MEVTNKGMRSNLDAFGTLNLRNNVRLAKAWNAGGEKAVLEELKKMHPEAAARTSQENPATK